VHPEALKHYSLGEAKDEGAYMEKRGDSQKKINNFLVIFEILSLIPITHEPDCICVLGLHEKYAAILSAQFLIL
jgi:hypothetical protein